MIVSLSTETPFASLTLYNTVVIVHRFYNDILYMSVVKLYIPFTLTFSMPISKADDRSNLSNFFTNFPTFDGHVCIQHEICIK